MADKKISAFASGAPALAADEMVVARSGANFKLTVAQILTANLPGYFSKLTIGTASDNGAMLRVASNQGAAPSANENTSGFSLVSTTAAGVGIGPSARFSGESGNAVTPYVFAILQGRKASAVAADYSGELAIRVSNSAGSIIEPVTVSPSQVTVGVALSAASLSVSGQASVTGQMFVNHSTGTAGANNLQVTNTQSGTNHFTGLALVSDLSRQLQIGYTSSGYTANAWMGANAGFMFNNQAGGLALIASGGSVKFSMNLTNLHQDFTATEHRIWNTTDVVTNWERGFVRFNSNQFQIGTEKGGTGTVRDINIVATGGTASVFLSTNNTGRWQVDGNGHLLAFADSTNDLGASAKRPRDVYVARDLYVAGGTQAVFRSSANITSGAGAFTGTLTNAPAAGPPTKWVPINDNGTTRYFPAW